MKGLSCSLSSRKIKADGLVKIGVLAIPNDSKDCVGVKCLCTNGKGTSRHFLSSVEIYSSMSGLVGLELLVFVGDFPC